jgi:N-acetylmuramoyl-L-alanine amidase
MRGFLTFFVITAALLLTSANTLNLVPNKVRKVIIDAGHGGKDPGCVGTHSKEKDVALDIAMEVGALIKVHLKDVQVVYTRKRNEFVELRERARIANKEMGDLFISIHCNASESSAIQGTETYVMGLNSSDDNLKVAMRENEALLKEEGYIENYDGFDPESPVSYILMANYQNTYQANSLKMARNVEGNFKNRLLRYSRGVKQAGFVVLWKTAMPSILVETGFLTNSTDENYLNADKGKSYIASSLYTAFRDYKQDIEGKNNR